MHTNQWMFDCKSCLIHLCACVCHMRNEIESIPRRQTKYAPIAVVFNIPNRQMKSPQKYRTKFKMISPTNRIRGSWNKCHEKSHFQRNKNRSVACFLIIVQLKLNSSEIFFHPFSVVFLPLFRSMCTQLFSLVEIRLDLFSMQNAERDFKENDFPFDWIYFYFNKIECISSATANCLMHLTENVPEHSIIYWRWCKYHVCVWERERVCYVRFIAGIFYFQSIMGQFMSSMCCAVPVFIEHLIIIFFFYINTMHWMPCINKFHNFF